MEGGGKGEGRWCQWWSETRGRRRSRRSLRAPPARKQTDRPSDNEGEKSAKRHTRTQSSFLGQRDRSRRMGVPAGGGRTNARGGGWVATTRVSLARAGGGGRGIPVARGRAPALSWSRVDGNAPPLAPPRAPGRSRRGAWRRDPEKDPRRRALPGSTLASARRAPKAAARRAGAGAGSAAARSRSAAGRSGANERAPSSDLARALVTEPARGAGRRRKAGRVGAGRSPGAGAGSSEGRTSRPARRAWPCTRGPRGTGRPDPRGRSSGSWRAGGGARARTLREWDVGRWARDGAVLEFANRRASARKSFFRLTRIPTPPLFALYLAALVRLVREG